MNTASNQAPAWTAGGHWLMTSAAAKVDLTHRLRSALNERALRLYATDVSPLSAAFHFSDDHFVSLPSDHPDYWSATIKACRERDIRVILPTRDAELLFFAGHSRTFIEQSIWPLVSDENTVALCLDKIRFHAHCEAHGVPVLPRMEMPRSADYPCFVRHRSGSAGRHAVRIPDQSTMQASYGDPPWPDVLVQSCCNDAEYTIDALFGVDGRLAQWIARERVQVKAGESVVSRTVSVPALDTLMSALAETLPCVGPVTVQAFYSEENGARLIEVNPRLGGACALGIEAGMDIPERLVALAQGDTDAFERARPLRYGLTMLRYSRDIFVSE